jgi:alpha-amylase
LGYTYTIFLRKLNWSPCIIPFQFANAVSGQAMGNWQVKDGSLGFSRGQKGFFAMGNLNNVSFFTGLPDGEYCDIIHNCQQKITVSGGWANFNKAQANDPVVAICVGCS